MRIERDGHVVRFWPETVGDVLELNEFYRELGLEQTNYISNPQAIQTNRKGRKQKVLVTRPAKLTMDSEAKAVFERWYPGANL